MRARRIAARAARGMATVELALVSMLVAGALGFGVWVLAQLVAYDLCQVTAHEVARQAARGDRAAVARATADRPAGSTVTVTDAAVTEDGGVLHVTVGLTAGTEEILEVTV